MRLVICGAGIMGSSTAYYLAERGVACTVLERCEPACAASGKAGGFLARTWCDSYELGPMARTSYDMHMALAEEPRFSGCDYRRLDTLSVAVKEGTTNNTPKGAPTWVNGAVVRASVLGTTANTAQVNPYKLTQTFLEIAKEKAGTEVKVTQVQDIVLEGRKVTGVKCIDGIIPADVVVVAMGPWSSQLARQLKFTPVGGQRAHSVILRPVAEVTAHALFVDYRMNTGSDRSPEVYPRPDGTVYICGEGDKVKHPDNPSDVTPNLDACKRLQDMGAVISSNLKGAEVVESRACYLPTTTIGLPMIGAIPDTEGAFIATGHSCWGILNAPATGAALAELITTGKCTTVDLSPFLPSKHG